ncbi:MAG: hypothetical protein Q9161_009339 [Pseudevernia consocians]
MHIATHKKMYSGKLLRSVLLFLVFFTTCHAQPVKASSLISTVNNAAQGRDDVEVIQSLERDDERAAAAATTRLRPRVLLGFHEYLDIGGGWNMYYSARPAIALPVQPAAWALAHLYTSILIHARGKWAKSPPQYGFVFTYGGVRILMHCPQKPIPWLFVGNFAEKLLQITEGGWTGVYQVMLSQAESDISIGVQLSMAVT